MEEKPIHVKPSFYAYCFYKLKDLAKSYGYNLVVHGSMNTDLDLIAIPWSSELGNVEDMIEAFAILLGGYIMEQSEKAKNCFPHGRQSYVINLARSYKMNNYEDRKYYLDISVIPPPNPEQP